MVARWIADDYIDTHPPMLARDHTRHAQSLGHAYRRYSGRWLDDIRVEPDGVTDGSKRWMTRLLENVPVDNSAENKGVRGLRGPVLPTHESINPLKGVAEPSPPTQIEVETSPLSPLVPFTTESEFPW